MEYFKDKYNLIISLFVFIILGCSADEGKDNSPLVISVTNFEPSYDQVKINWEVSRPNGVIIEDLLVCRSYKNDETNYSTETVIANLPSNETTFIDNDVPYTKEVIYSIKINYKDERNKTLVINNLTSEPKKFIRELVTFDRVPFQVQKDPLQTDIFHILDKSGIGTLKRYNSAENKITNTKAFSESWTMNNRFQIINNTDIYVANYFGKIFKINPTNYNTTATFSATIIDKLNAFAIDGDRIYYQDDEILKYHTMTTNISTSMDNAMSFQYLENLSPGVFLFLYNISGYGSSASVSQMIGNCPDGTNCYFGNIAATTQSQLTANAIDPNIFAWNQKKTKFISSIDGRIFNLATLKQEKKLNDISGKHYIQYVFDNENNIYAAVQGEKLIHKFNANYELVEKISTKLFPIFPILTNNGLQVIGAYEPVSYWNYEYGNGFNFNVKCAIEPLK